MLSRFRLLDLSRLAPGPNASRLLADMGMEVIKVEEPRPRGGFDRDTLTPVDASDAERTRAAAFNVLGRNKKSISIDLKSEAGRDAFYRLVDGADVVLEGYRPGVAARLGVDHPTLAARNPRLVYCSISGFGQDGPYARRPAHDANFQAVAGMLALGSDEAGHPRHPGFSVGDHGAALHAALGILAALLGREENGRGQHIDVSITETLPTFVPTYASRYLMDGTRRPRGEHWPFRLMTLRCKDGLYLCTQNAETYFWERFCRAIGLPHLIPHRDAASPEHPRVVREIQERMLTRTRDEWLEILTEAETCVTPLHEFGEAFDRDPQLRQRGALWELEHPSAGRVRQIGFPMRFSETPARFRSFAPELGQHTRELLREAGYSDAEVEELLKSGAVKG